MTVKCEVSVVRAYDRILTVDSARRVIRLKVVILLSITITTVLGMWGRQTFYYYTITGAVW